MLGKFMGPDPELFKRVAMVFGSAGLFLVLAFTFSDSVLAFATGSAVGAVLLVVVLVGIALLALRAGLMRLCGLPAPWGRVVGIGVSSWIGAYIASLLVALLPALLVGGWIALPLQVLFFTALGAWLYLNWGQGEDPEPAYQAPEPAYQEAPRPYQAPEPVTEARDQELDPQEARIAARRQKLLDDAETGDDLLSE